MMDYKNLTMDTLLTVKDAARVSNFSVPTFYTEQRKRDFGFDPESNSQWLIPVALLVEHGFLTHDFQPMRSIRKLTQEQNGVDVDQVNVENAELRKSNGELRNRIAVLEVLVGEKEKQLDMVNALIARLGSVKN
jgi:hypothetical protein